MMKIQFNSKTDAMRPTYARSHLLLATILLSHWSAIAQTANLNTALRGTIIDFKSKEPLANVKVELRNQGREVMSDSQGRFELKNLKPGDVEITINTVGYSKFGQKIQLPGPRSHKAEQSQYI